MPNDVYASAGVDTSLAEKAMRLASPLFKQTWYSNLLPGGPHLGFKQFANVVSLDSKSNVGIAITTDGVGSKSLLAHEMMIYDTIGIDCVAMNVNDLLCVGADPLSFVDYIAVDKLEPNVFQSIADGLSFGALKAGVSLVGGETAQLPGIINGFDLAGTAIGKVNLNRIITGNNIQPGDAVIGLASSGIHSNGITLVRKIFGRSLHNYTYDGVLLCEELLRPTEIYVDEAIAIRESCRPKALINITGGGFNNLLRVDSDVGYCLDRLPKPSPLFKVIEKEGKVDRREMYNIFNMGIGFCAIVSPSYVYDCLSILDDYGCKSYV